GIEVTVGGQMPADCQAASTGGGSLGSNPKGTTHHSKWTAVAVPLLTSPMMSMIGTCTPPSPGGRGTMVQSPGRGPVTSVGSGTVRPGYSGMVVVLPSASGCLLSVSDRKAMRTSPARAS